MWKALYAFSAIISTPRSLGTHVLPSTSTLSTGSPLGSESTLPSKTLNFLASTHFAAQRQSHHIPSTKSPSETPPRQGWKTPPP